MALPKSTGLYELGLVLVMTRDKGETAQQWLQRMDQGRTVVGRKLGGNNLSDSCYVELLLRGLGNKEKGELIKAQVLRHTKTPYRKDARVLVTSDDKAYRAVVTRAYMDNGETYVDVKYDNVPGFTSNVEEGRPSMTPLTTWTRQASKPCRLRRERSQRFCGRCKCKRQRQAPGCST